MIRIHKIDGGYVEIKRRKKRKSTGRKRGRPRKQQPILQEPKSRKRPYSIILTSNGKQKKCFKTFRTEQDARKAFYDMIENNSNAVLFPIKHTNSNGIKDIKYELFIIKRIDGGAEKSVTMLRNDIGEFVEYDTNMSNWEIVDKSDWQVEETFWVNGYHPKYQRKTFSWIFDNFIGGSKKDFSLFKNVLVYQNKLIVDDGDTVNIVFCKCVRDSFRLYNEIERVAMEQKYKNIMFSGNIRDLSKSTVSAWIDRLCEVTGFNRQKIKRNSLRP